MTHPLPFGYDTPAMEPSNLTRHVPLRLARRTFMALVTGGLLATPLAVEAQQAAKTYRISFLALTPGEDTTLMKALREHLHELGYNDEGRPERLSQLATELVRARPDVLIAGFGTLAAQAAKAATTSIPIVFTTVGDPVGAGLVASLGRPGGNATGLTDQAKDLGSKQLQLPRSTRCSCSERMRLSSDEVGFESTCLRPVDGKLLLGGTSPRKGHGK